MRDTNFKLSKDTPPPSFADPRRASAYPVPLAASPRLAHLSSPPAHCSVILAITQKVAGHVTGHSGEHEHENKKMSEIEAM